MLKLHHVACNEEEGGVCKVFRDGSGQGEDL